MKYLRIALLSCLASGTLNLQASQSPEKSPNKMNAKEVVENAKKERLIRAEKRKADEANLTEEEKDAKRIEEKKAQDKKIQDFQERAQHYTQELAILAQHQAERQAQKNAAQAEPKTTARVHFEQSSPMSNASSEETQKQQPTSSNDGQLSPESQTKITRVPMMPSPSNNEPKKSLNEILKATPVDSGTSDSDSDTDKNNAQAKQDAAATKIQSLAKSYKARKKNTPSDPKNGDAKEQSKEELSTINRVRRALGLAIIDQSAASQNNANQPNETPFNGLSDEDEKARQLLWEMYQLDIQKLREERDSLIEQLKNNKLSAQDRKLLEAKLVFNNTFIKDYEEDNKSARERFDATQKAMYQDVIAPIIALFTEKDADNKSAWQRLQDTLQAIDKDIVTPGLRIITLAPVYDFLVETEAEQQEATRGKFFEASAGMTAKQRFHFTKRTMYNHANAAFKNARNAVASLISMVIEQNS